MGPDSDGGAPMRSRRRSRLAVLVVCAGLLLGQPAPAASQPAVGRGTVAQLDQSFREPFCRLIQSFQVSFGGFPGVSELLASLLQSFGCPGDPGPGTTTTLVGTTTTVPSGTTTSTLAPTTSTTSGGPTSSTTPTTLPPCMVTTSMPTTFPPTTVPCIPPVAA